MKYLLEACSNFEEKSVQVFRLDLVGYSRLIQEEEDGGEWLMLQSSGIGLYTLNISPSNHPTTTDTIHARTQSSTKRTYHNEQSRCTMSANYRLEGFHHCYRCSTTIHRYTHSQRSGIKLAKIYTLTLKFPYCRSLVDFEKL